MSQPLPPAEANRTSADPVDETPVTLVFIELSEAEMDALIQRVQTAIADDLALSKSDLQLILSALGSLLHLQNQIGDNRVTLHKLRKLLGLVNASEKLQGLMKGGQQDDQDSQEGDQHDDEGKQSTADADKDPDQSGRQSKNPR